MRKNPDLWDFLIIWVNQGLTDFYRTLFKVTFLCSCRQSLFWLQCMLKFVHRLTFSHYMTSKYVLKSTVSKILSKTQHIFHWKSSKSVSVGRPRRSLSNISANYFRVHLHDRADTKHEDHGFKPDQAWVQLSSRQFILSQHVLTIR